MVKQLGRARYILSMIAPMLFFSIAVLPVAMVLVNSFFNDGSLSWEHYTPLFSDTRVQGILLRSTMLATCSTLLSLSFGLPFAVFLARCHFWGKKVCSCLFLVPLFIPSHIHALAWIYLLGEQGRLTQPMIQWFHLETSFSQLYTFTGAAFILFLSYFPLMVLLIVSGLSTVDKRLEESALFVHPPMTSLFRVTLPLVMPHIITGCVFVFLFSFFNYGVPSMLRVPSYPEEIFIRFSAFYDEGGAAALAVPAIFLALFLLVFQNRFMKTRRYTTINAEQVAGYYTLPRPITGCIGLYMIALLTISVFLPISALCLQAKTIDSFKVALQGAHNEIITTLLIGVTSATCATILSVLLTYCKERLPQRKKSLFQMLYMVPFAFPATFVGIGMIYLWNNKLTEYVYGSLTIVILACLARFLPFSLRVAEDGIKQIDPKLREAAAMFQPSMLQKWWRIDLRLMRRGITVCWIITFVFTTGELGATLLVIPPGSGTLSLKIYTLMHYGAGPLVAALALILIVINLFIASGLIPNKTKQI